MLVRLNDSGRSRSQSCFKVVRTSGGPIWIFFLVLGIKARRLYHLQQKFPRLVCIFVGNQEWRCGKTWRSSSGSK